MLRKYVRQLKRPIQEKYIAPIDKVQRHFGFLNELTISPTYVMKGVENPFYDLDIDIEKDIRPAIGKGEIKFKNVKMPSGTEIKNYGGKFKFQINLDDSDTDKYVTTTQKMVKSHLGQKQRKDATASSNVNEFLTVYFLLHTNYTNPKEFMEEIGGKIGDTGVLNGEGYDVDYDELRILLDKDETPERDIAIGYENSLAVISDLSGRTIDDVFWVPRKKPEGIGEKNPSDVVVKLADGGFVGYSNKISAGADKTPKINTSITAFYEKLKDTAQLKLIHSLTHEAWNHAKGLIPRNKKSTYNAINKFSIEKEKFSETASKLAFAKLSKEFKKDKLDFYTDGYYYSFRNKLIEVFSNHISNPRNLTYFLNTVAYYTYDDPDVTPCPYKLLVGSEKGSSVKEVSSDETNREIFFNDKPTNYTNVKTKYDNKQQTFTLYFTYKPLNVKFEAPIVLRTRAKGGWSGKSLYITTSGFKKK